MAPCPDAAGLYALLLPLERLDESWTEVLRLLITEPSAPVSPDFDVPFEQLLAALLYRHLPGALDDGLT